MRRGVRSAERSDKNKDPALRMRRRGGVCVYVYVYVYVRVCVWSAEERRWGDEGWGPRRKEKDKEEEEEEKEKL